MRYQRGFAHGYISALMTMAFGGAVLQSAPLWFYGVVVLVWGLAMLVAAKSFE